jgi:predicted nucleic acid-binding Zn ribbon protein
VIRKLGDILREYIAEKGWPAEDPYAPIFLRWESIVGEELGGHSRPVELEKSALIVEADHPGWVQTICLRKTELIRALRRAAPEADIGDLRVRLQRGGAKGRGSMP